MTCRFRLFGPLAIFLPVLGPGAAHAAPGLRLVPWPREVRQTRGTCQIRPDARLTVPPEARALADAVARDAKIATGVHVTVATGPGPSLTARLVSGKAAVAALDPPDRSEAYALRVGRDGAVCVGRDARGLLWGLQALRQLFRANVRGAAIPCVDILDYPALRYRATQDDITRGPSPTLASLEREAELCGLLRLNTFTTYLEHQFAHAKHPKIGPENGSLLPAELRQLVRFSDQRGIEIVGNQQSFGHFYHILKHPEYASLRETADVLCPTNDASYDLLSDLYADQAPLLTSPLFNVCCDETWGLGTGPSKSTADRVGVGAVYVKHIQRVHGILRDRFRKRMMMWGDIILQHPQHIAEIPKDTVLLSWGYDARPSFEESIVPFTKCGFEFWVCPGISNWSRILPDFGTASVNIRNYVRDGVKHGATGMLNTVWNDDGETLFGPNWPGIAWGAECAWAGATTERADFLRRLGGVLFGEPGSDFGKAIDLLSRATAAPGFDGMFNARYWRSDFAAQTADEAQAIRQATQLLAVVEPAIAHLRRTRATARFDVDIVDHVLYGAERMRLIASRMLSFIEARHAYTVAAERNDRAAALRALQTIVEMRAQHGGLWSTYVRLWHSEKRPYGLDVPEARFRELDRSLAYIEERLTTAIRECGAARTWPTAEDIGLGLAAAASDAMTARIVTSEDAPPSRLPWDEPTARTRVVVRLSATPSTLPRPVLIPLSGAASSVQRPTVRVIGADGSSRALSSQAVGAGGSRALALILPPTETAASTLVIYSGTTRSVDTSPAIVRSEGRGRWTIDNGALRLLLGSEGAHLYRWQVAALGSRDLTHPGETDWSGFADITGAHRNSPNKVRIVAQGPVLARLECSDTAGLRKTFDIWRGLPWVDCRLGGASTFFACYDDIALMGASSSAPASSLFSDGWEGRVRPLSQSPDCQDSRTGVTWCAKASAGSALLGLITPGVPTRHVVGPGAGMGGVVVEGGQAAARFVIVGTECPKDPAKTMADLAALVSPDNRPVAAVGHLETRPGR